MNTMKFYNQKGDCLKIKITQVNWHHNYRRNLPYRREAIRFAASKGFYRKQDL